jgi:hypothetical protein
VSFGRGRWRAVAVLGLWAAAQASAHALGLAELTVQSALGTPLRAEIRVTGVTAEDVANLRAAVPPPDTFIAAGADYHPPLGTVRITVARRAGDREHDRPAGRREHGDGARAARLHAGLSGREALNVAALQRRTGPPKGARGH